jgi:hypothetical protein
MIHTGLKQQGEISLDYQYTLNLKREGQEGKIGLFWGWVPKGGWWAQGEGEGGRIW